MKWSYEDIVEKLENDYVTHWHNYHYYGRNDNEVDMNWESAVCDYLFDLLKCITGASPTELADILEDKIEGVFLFDPQASCQQIIDGQKVCLMQDVYYTDYDSFRCMFEEEELDDLLQNVVYVDGDNDVYLMKGTHMTYKGIERGAGGFPTFDVHGYEFDFAGNPFKIKKV